MIFVDTNVFMYAVGGTHPLREEARAFFRDTLTRRETLVTSVEVLQELMHAYLPVDRTETLHAAMALARARMAAVWPVDVSDIDLALALCDAEEGLEARDLIHLACARRRDARAIKTFDRGLAAAFARL